LIFAVGFRVGFARNSAGHGLATIQRSSIGCGVPRADVEAAPAQASSSCLYLGILAKLPRIELFRPRLALQHIAMRGFAGPESVQHLLSSLPLE
jgi:hypothetical protein